MESSEERFAELKKLHKELSELTKTTHHNIKEILKKQDLISNTHLAPHLEQTFKATKTPISTLKGCIGHLNEGLDLYSKYPKNYLDMEELEREIWLLECKLGKWVRTYTLNDDDDYEGWSQLLVEKKTLWQQSLEKKAKDKEQAEERAKEREAEKLKAENGGEDKK